MKITICGSMAHKVEMVTASEDLVTMGYEVDFPDLNEGHTYEGKTHEERVADKKQFISSRLGKISTSDAVLIWNQEKRGVAGYVGGNTLMEMAFAFQQGLDILMLNPVPQDVSYSSEISGMQPVVLDGDISRVDSYFATLPRVLMSTKSVIKHRAVSRGLRRAGISVMVSGIQTESGVSEQPKDIAETYNGATNRHSALREYPDAGDYDYLATIESGNHLIHPDHNYFGCSVIIIETKSGETKVGIDLDLELPKSMTDKVPSVYPDLGILVQKEYGSKAKDPFPYFTNGKIDRLKILEDSVFSVAVQLDNDNDRNI
jgi:non-canonical (house-cleaning) NTP pyrophosphatase